MHFSLENVKKDKFCNMLLVKSYCLLICVCVGVCVREYFLMLVSQLFPIVSFYEN